jgi:hypothetical protein
MGRGLAGVPRGTRKRASAGRKLALFHVGHEAGSSPRAPAGGRDLLLLQRTCIVVHAEPIRAAGGSAGVRGALSGVLEEGDRRRLSRRGPSPPSSASACRRTTTRARFAASLVSAPVSGLSPAGGRAPPRRAPPPWHPRFCQARAANGHTRNARMPALDMLADSAAAVSAAPRPAASGTRTAAAVSAGSTPRCLGERARRRLSRRGPSPPSSASAFRRTTIHARFAASLGSAPVIGLSPTGGRAPPRRAPPPWHPR